MDNVSYSFFPMRWVLLVNVVPITCAKELEIKQTVFALKWFGLPRCTSDMALYSNSVPCSLLLKSIVTLFKETTIASFFQLKYSKDLQAKRTLVEHRIGFKWGTKGAIAKLKCELKKRMS